MLQQYKVWMTYEQKNIMHLILIAEAERLNKLRWSDTTDTVTANNYHMVLEIYYQIDHTMRRMSNEI